MKQIASLALCATILIALPACDAQEEQEVPVLTLVNDTEDVVVYDIWGEGWMMPAYPFPMEASLEELYEGPSTHNPFTAVVETHHTIPLSKGAFDVECIVPPQRKGWLISLHVYNYNILNERAMWSKGFSFNLGEEEIELLKSTDCKIHMSDIVFLEQLEELSFP